MARIRTMKPEFFKNEELAELPFEYRLLFQGLWCLADRRGRLEDRPKRIKADVFPYDNVDVDAGLDALQARGFIERYEHENVRYLQVKNFEKHQNCNIKEAESTIPAPFQHSASTEKKTTVGRERKGKERKGTGNTSCRDDATTDDVSLEIVVAQNPPEPTPEEHWHEFLLAYPRRLGDLGKAKGRDKFLRLLRDGISAEELIAGARRYSAFLTATGRLGTEFVKQIPTFLNAKAWQEEFEVDVGSTQKPQAIDHLARIRHERESREARLACPD